MTFMRLTRRRSQYISSGFKKSPGVFAAILTFVLLVVLSATVLAAHSPLQEVHGPPLRTTFETPPPATPPAPLPPETSDARYYQAALYGVQAHQELEAHRWHNALLLSLEAAQVYDDGTAPAATIATLRDVLAHPMREMLYLPHDLPVGGAAWNHDETRLLVWLGSAAPNCDPCQGELRIYESTNSAQPRIMAIGDSARGAQWNQDGTRVLAWSPEGSLYLWDTSTGVLSTYPGTMAVAGVAWSPDESKALAWSYSGRARVYNLNETGHSIYLPFPGPEVWGAAFSHDGTRVLVYGGGTIEICLSSCHHQLRVYDLAAPGEPVLVWDIRQPERPLVLSHERDVRGVAWSPDSSRILTWSSDGKVRVWMVDIKLLVARVAALKVREFTPAERTQFYLP